MNILDELILEESSFVSFYILHGECKFNIILSAFDLLTDHNFTASQASEFIIPQLEFTVKERWW